MIIPFARRRTPLVVALAAAILGAAAAVHYHRAGLTLSHYDARGHLVVARRIVDSITPGWQQIGAVWLPLPHLLNALPVQIDFFFRTGASAVAISMLSFAVAAGGVAWIVLAITGSHAAALAAACVFALNPNVLYLQATPMTEPLLLALTTCGVAMMIAWSTRPALEPVMARSGDANTSSDDADTAASLMAHRDGAAASNVAARGDAPASVLAEHTEAGVAIAAGRRDDAIASMRFERATGLVIALACMTRYEAWPIAASAFVLAAWTVWPRGGAIRPAVRAVATVAIYPAIAIAGFAIFSRVVIGEWFVAGGFFVPENKALGDAAMAVKEIAWGTQALSGRALVWIAGAGLVAIAGIGLAVRSRAASLIALSLLASAAIPWAAFYRGHPFRVRYMVPLIAIEAIGAGAAAGLVRRAALPASLGLIALTAATLRPFDPAAPMVVEAQWDRPNAPVRARVTACLGAPVPGEKIMASMGSLGHYMQEASAAGFSLRDFLHEGNGDIWLAAIERPRPFADWLLIEEKAEGGDMLAHIAREHPHFLDGYSRVCEGAGLALYRRNAN